jgi:DNA primase
LTAARGLSKSIGLSSAMLSEDKLREIRDSVDLVALISEYVPLRRMGARFVGLCPFHSEKTPSFGVSRGKPFYYCFGCQATGDAITFVRHVEGLGFMEAVEKLAERAGIEVERTDDAGQLAMRQARARRERLAELMGLAQSFYEEQLYEHAHADLARAELAKRKVRDDVARTFHLGYAPASWDALTRHLTQKRVNLEEASELGLIGQRTQGAGYYDRFRHRLMFPVADQHGRVIAFSGRALTPPVGTPPESAPPAKYINSPEGPLYKKGSALFGLSTARVAMRKHNQVLLCEGNFDLVAIHQAGFEHVLAPLGTAFTLEQAKLIRRFAEEVIVIFDGDGAGRKATATAFELLTAAGLKGRAVRLPDGQDPDSFLSEHGPEALTQMVASAPPILDFLIDQASSSVSDATGRARAIQQLAPYLARIESPLERSLYVERLARKFEIRDLNSVRAELRRGLGVNSDRRTSSDIGAQRARTSPTPEKPAIRMRSTKELPERQRIVLGVLLDHPELIRTIDVEGLAGLLTDSDLRAIFLDTAQMLELRGEVDALALLEGLSSNPARAWLGERLSAVPMVDRERAERLLVEGMPLLERDRKNEQRAQLSREIQIANQTGNQTRAQELMRLRDELAKT